MNATISPRSAEGSAQTLALRPPLKWAGGKRWLLPHLRPLWERHAHRRLVEPFSGGLAVTLGLLPREAVINDVNPHLINFYRWLQRGLTIDLEMENDEELYYEYRSSFNTRIGAPRRAASRETAGLFYYLNRTGFNGLCRFNRSGEYNVPFGRYSQINYLRDFSTYRQPLSNWTLSDGDFSQVPIRSSDFVYADPPYDVEFTQYAKDGFTWSDQVRLAERLSEHRGPVVLSNQATPRILKLYRSLDFKLELLDAPRRISCTGDRTDAREVLATKNI